MKRQKNCKNNKDDKQLKLAFPSSEFTFKSLIRTQLPEPQL